MDVNECVDLINYSLRVPTHLFKIQSIIHERIPVVMVRKLMISGSRLKKKKKKKTFVMTVTLCVLNILSQSKSPAEFHK